MAHQLLFYREPSSITRFDDYVREVAGLGIKQITLATVMGDLDLQKQRDVICALGTLQESGVAARGMHGPFAGDRDLNTLGAHSIHTPILPRCAELGVRTYVLHAGLRDDHLPTNRQWGDVRRNLDHLIPAAEKSNVVLALENLPPAYLGNCADDLVALIQAYDSPFLRLCFDSGHAHMNGSATGILRQMAPYVATMHLHDNDGSLDSHLTPGHGTIAWTALAGVINGECRPFHVEIEAFNSEGLSVSEILAVYDKMLA